jgi:hypothetical protein
VDYQYSDVGFREGETTGGGTVNPDYDDNAISIYLKYLLGALSSLDIDGGYVNRRYPHGSLGSTDSGNFSGDVWHVMLNWQPTVQSGIKIKEWRDLRAYIDAESNYFISRGTSISPVWSPLERLVVTVEFSFENQNFIGSNLLVDSLPRRRDSLTFTRAGVAYKIRRRVEIDVGYKYEKRTSDIDYVRYKDNLASVSVQYTF